MALPEERTLYITNLHENVTKELLEEIFTQMGPVESVAVISNASRFAFVQFADEESVPFSIKMMNGLKLFNVPLTVKPRGNTNQDRLYRSQYGFQQRRHSQPHRSEQYNDYDADYQPHSNRRSVADRTPAHSIPGRFSQNPGHYPLHSSLPYQDSFTTNPPRGSRTIGGYYVQPHRSNSAGHRSNNQRNGGNSWR
jgi:RNA recognition motif-containing protein